MAAKKVKVLSLDAIYVTPGKHPTVLLVFCDEDSGEKRFELGINHYQLNSLKEALNA